MKVAFRILLSLTFLLSFVGSGEASAKKVGSATVELISEVAEIKLGQTFYLGLNFELEPHWHVYWKNPGASGLPVEISWELPEGFEAGEIQWPAPERIELSGLVNYGYEDAVTFIVPIQAPEDLKPDNKLLFKADVFWLICKEACVPGDAELSIELNVGNALVKSSDAPLFEAARERLPQVNAPWTISARVDSEALVFVVEPLGGQVVPDELYFYAASEGIVDPSADQILSHTDEKSVELKMPIAMEQLGQPLESFSGILQSAGESWKVEVLVGSSVVKNNSPMTTVGDQEGFESFLLKLGLPGWLVLAFVGGFILNLMPCVLPVLSLKVFSVMKHTGQSRVQALLHGIAYSLGVIASFLILAGVLIGLRTFGQQVGWGFQLQSPVFVAVLTVFMFLFSLNLMGVFEIGAGLVGADSSVSKRHDLWGSLGMGTLAAVVGAPCIGPFLAPVSGIALQADAGTALLIFGFMGFGLASPFLLLSVFPGLANYLPKPGAWMESLRQFMGFLLMATVVFFVYVFGELRGSGEIIRLLIALLITAFAAWIYGRWSVPVKPKRTRRIARAVFLFLLMGSFVYAISENRAETWENWSTERVEEALAEERPVFVDFTASWCLICQANKNTALRTETTKALFEEYDVLALEADWTRRDAGITKELERFGRSGVPLYLFYAPDGQVTVLPQNLTNGNVREAIENALN